MVPRGSRLIAVPGSRISPMGGCPPGADNDMIRRLVARAIAEDSLGGLTISFWIRTIRLSDT